MGILISVGHGKPEFCRTLEGQLNQVIAGGLDLLARRPHSGEPVAAGTPPPLVLPESFLGNRATPSGSGPEPEGSEKEDKEEQADPKGSREGKDRSRSRQRSKKEKKAKKDRKALKDRSLERVIPVKVESRNSSEEKERPAEERRKFKRKVRALHS